LIPIPAYAGAEFDAVSKPLPYAPIPKVAGPIHAAIASRSANQVPKPPRINIQRNHLPNAVDMSANDIFFARILTPHRLCINILKH
jgi:hypothetical protein